MLGQAPVEGAEQGQVLLEGDGNLGIPEGREELQQHPRRTRQQNARVKPGESAKFRPGPAGLLGLFCESSPMVDKIQAGTKA